MQLVIYIDGTILHRRGKCETPRPTPPALSLLFPLPQAPRISTQPPRKPRPAGSHRRCACHILSMRPKIPVRHDDAVHPAMTGSLLVLWILLLLQVMVSLLFDSPLRRRLRRPRRRRRRHERVRGGPRRRGIGAEGRGIRRRRGAAGADAAPDGGVPPHAGVRAAGVAAGGGPTSAPPFTFESVAHHSRLGLFLFSLTRVRATRFSSVLALSIAVVCSAHCCPLPLVLCSRSSVALA